MTRVAIILLLFLWLAGQSVRAGDPLTDNLSLRGYIKAMPGLNLDKDFSDPGFHNVLHNRLNFRWDISENVDLRIEGRNRLMYSKMFAEIPDVEDILGQDDGLADMSWVWFSDDRLIGLSEIDRLYLSWRADNWRIRIGRQRINWGINLVSNPNDLFNTYSFFDFDYVERPGSDALRIQHYLGGLSSIELAVNPARNTRDMVAAAKFAHNLHGYDIQVITGYFRDRFAAGGGWAGHIGAAGFKGEATWFYDLEERAVSKRSNLVAATGIDYMFVNGTFVVAEFLYNGGYGRQEEGIFMITQPLQPDNIMFSEFAVTLSADREFSPIFSSGLALMALPDIDAAFVMPRFNYSVMTNVDFQFIAQIFLGGENTLFEQAGSSWFVSLQYSF